MRFAAALILVSLSALASIAACDRERVDVGDIDGGGETAEVDAQQTIVPQVDGGFDVVLVTCGPPPAVGRCPPCPNGYAPGPDAEPTCDCCP